MDIEIAEQVHCENAKKEQRDPLHVHRGVLRRRTRDHRLEVRQMNVGVEFAEFQVFKESNVLSEGDVHREGLGAEQLRQLGQRVQLHIDLLHSQHTETQQRHQFVVLDLGQSRGLAQSPLDLGTLV